MKLVTGMVVVAALAVTGCGAATNQSQSISTQAAIVTPPRGPSGADGTYNCADFDTHQQAQDYFDQAGDIDGLDGDHDGIACEALP
jgi:micrococcal nuclease